MAKDIRPTEMLIAKLERRHRLDNDDRTALHDLACTVRQVPAQNYLVREGERPVTCAFITQGFAYRHKITTDGARQIVGFMIPGDFTDLQQLFLKEADHNVQLLTRLETAELPISALQQVAMARPAVARALWIDTLIEASITRETVLNIGRRSGPARVAHLICEFETRLGAAGLADEGYDMPMTQEQIGDATGLTSVHVNRTLKQLEREGLINRKMRALKIVDWEGLQARADFNPRYLHLDQTTSSLPRDGRAPAH